MEELKTVELVKGDASKTTMLRTTLPSTIVDDLISFLKESLDLFAQTHKDMLGIDESIIEHHLNIYPKKKLVQQRHEYLPPSETKPLWKKQTSSEQQVSFEKFITQSDWLTSSWLKSQTGNGGCVLISLISTKHAQKIAFCERPCLWPLLFLGVIGPNPHEWVESCYCHSKWRFD